MNTASFSIGAVERETGLSKDVLRTWERRYGFPAPERDANGERLYTPEQVNRLLLIKRLMDQGHRPGRLIAAPGEELATLSPRRSSAPAVAPQREGDELSELLMLIKQHDAAGYLQAMQQRLVRQGLQRFVEHSVAPLTREVGEAWEDGRFEVFDEHLFTELTKRLLRQAIAALPVPGGRPRVLLTSVPDESHVLGLLMVEALLALEGAHCVPLGTQMPLVEIARAAVAHRVDIVALSFSAAFPTRQVPGILQHLRTLLPAGVALWAGGSGLRRTVPQEGALLLFSLSEAIDALADWRADHA
jgi:DNA-binding transcriptional MerR regulator/methylmalonyl-CoA mutase cobalamin-binding subunit